MTTDQRLLPCPFCGATPILHERINDRHRPVECPTHACPMHHLWPDIAAWNTRAALPIEPSEPEPIKYKMVDGLVHYIMDEQQTTSIDTGSASTGEAARRETPETSTVPVLAHNMEKQDDHESNDRRTRWLAGERNDCDPRPRRESAEGVSGDGAAESDAGVLRSQPCGDSRQGNATRLRFNNDWLKHKIASDPDDEPSAGNVAETPEDETFAARVAIAQEFMNSMGDNNAPTPVTDALLREAHEEAAHRAALPDVADSVSETIDREPFKPFKSLGECTCMGMGPDGPCETCIANKEAYEEWYRERCLAATSEAEPEPSDDLVRPKRDK